MELMRRLDAAGIEILITDGYRSIAEQNALYAKGRTKPGPLVTNAKGGSSLHNYGLAIDIVPVKDKWQLNYHDHAAYQRVAEISAPLGIEWGIKKWAWDKPHFEYTGGLSIEAIRAGQRPEAWKAEDPAKKLARALNALKWANGVRKRMLERLIYRLMDLVDRA
jgi:peptidoglycan L-alanyl-D-glutamate endopeptidase CwlK